MNDHKTGIYIISLKNSHRRAIVSSRLESIGLNYKFVDAVDKNKLPANLDSYYDVNHCIQRHGRSLVATEIACFLSHMKAWKIVAEGNVCGIILEDDAKFTSNFVESIFVLEDGNFEADVVLLGHSKSLPGNQKKHYFYNPLRRLDLSGRFSIGSVYKLWTSGMVGYYLTPDAAQKLINANTIIKSVSDDWAYHSQNGLIIKELRPYTVWEDFQKLPSNIEPERYEASYHRKKCLNYWLEPVRFVRALLRNAMSIKNKFLKF